VIIGVDMNMVVDVIADKVLERKVKGGMAYVRLKNSPLNEIYIRSQPISFSLDVKHSFLGIVKIVPSIESDEDRELYRTLKGMECSLMYQGLLRRRPFFDNRKELNDLRQVISSITISNILVDTLNSDTRLFELIKNIRPSELNVILKSIHEEFLPFIISKEYLIKAEAKFYEDPSEITWYITMTHMLMRGPRFKKTVRGIFEILEIIAKHLREVTESVSRQ